MSVAKLMTCSGLISGFPWKDWSCGDFDFECSKLCHFLTRYFGFFSRPKIFSMLGIAFQYVSGLHIPFAVVVGGLLWEHFVAISLLVVDKLPSFS